MAQLKDTIVTGDLSVTGSIYGDVPIDDLSGYTGTAGFLKKENDSWSLSAVTIPDATSVKGNAETTYRTGQVNLTPANLGISATTSSVTVGSTTFNKYTHPTGDGNLHVPATSTTNNGKYLKAGSTAGSLSWASFVKPVVTWTAGTTAGPTLKVQATGGTSDAVAIPSANQTASGIVTTGDQDFAGIKGFGYVKRYGRTGSNTASQYVGDTILYNGASTPVKVGEYWYEIGNATNITKGQYAWRAYSPNSTANTSTTGYYETFALPNVTSGLTANAAYNILTSKNAVTVAQGGTGATTKKAAKTNLGITYGTAAPSGGADGDIYVQYNTSSAHPFLDLVYPVGSIYLSVSSTSPATLFGGTWARIKDQFLLAAGDTYANGEYGGEASHTLTTAEIPSHTHERGTMEIVGTWTINDDSDNAGLDAPSTGTGAITAKNGSGYGSSVGGSGWGVNRGFTFRASDNWTGATSAVGSGQAHNNMPPYLAVYMWKRTA